LRLRDSAFRPVWVSCSPALPWPDR
jgi:hypothetical protein